MQIALPQLNKNAHSLKFITAHLLDTKAVIVETQREGQNKWSKSCKPKQSLTKAGSWFIKAEFIVEKALDNLKKQGITAPNEAQIEQHRTIVRRATDSDTLTGDFVVYLNDGQTVTVGEILDNPSKYHSKETKDPLEPDYDGGRTVGRLYSFNGQPNLYSQAHGGKSYKLIRQPKEIEHKRKSIWNSTGHPDQVKEMCLRFFRYGRAVGIDSHQSVKNITADLLPYYLSSFIQYFTWKQKAKSSSFKRF